jgi:putative transposase
VATIKNMVLAPEYRHMPFGTLARYAERIGKVFASASTWAKLVRERGWRRPRQRVHPPKPTVGVRASQPNEIWHVDTTVINVLDGTKAYLQAVIDNYSRKILAWTVSARLDPSKTCQVLLAAGKHLVSSGRPLLYADSGVENENGAVDSNRPASWHLLVPLDSAGKHIGSTGNLMPLRWHMYGTYWLAEARTFT